MPCDNLFTLHWSFLHKKSCLNTGIRQLGFGVSGMFSLCGGSSLPTPNRNFVKYFFMKCCSSASWEVARDHLLIESREQTFLFPFGFSCTNFHFCFSRLLYLNIKVALPLILFALSISEVEVIKRLGGFSGHLVVSQGQPNTKFTN